MNATLSPHQAHRRARLKTGAMAPALALWMAGMTGCVNLSGLNGSPRYACQAPEGVACQSVSGTYATTAGPRATRPGLTPATPSASAAPGDASTLAPALSAAVAPSPPDLPSADGLPLRAAPRVLRLWIKPWEDADGDLHDQRYVYVQIDDGRWQIDHLQRRIRDAVAPARPAEAGASVASPLLPAQPGRPAPAAASPVQRFPATPAGRPLPPGAAQVPAASNAAPAPPVTNR